VQAVDDVSFTIKEGETLGLVGESGCGKTTLGRTMLRLIEPTSGSVRFDGTLIYETQPSELKSIRRYMQIVFQDPYTSLDPRKSIGESVKEGLNIHKIGNPSQRNKMVIDILLKVGLEDYHANRYPHEFSGGQRQRVGIARALVLRPKLIILDEPVSALDVSIQSQILNLLRDLQQEFGLAYLFISHNMTVVEHMCDRVAVMYLGKIVEIGPTKEILNNPLHPYTQALISAVPVSDPRYKSERIILTGEPPNPVRPPSGCRFHPRCPHKIDNICSTRKPTLIKISAGHWVSCWLFDGQEAAIIKDTKYGVPQILDTSK